MVLVWQFDGVAPLLGAPLYGTIPYQGRGIYEKGGEKSASPSKDGRRLDADVQSKQPQPTHTEAADKP